jgi:hypothetical protein
MLTGSLSICSPSRPFTPYWIAARAGTGDFPIGAMLTCAGTGD